MNRFSVLEEKYFHEENCRLARVLHLETMIKTEHQEQYFEEIKNLRNKEKDEFQRLIREGQNKLTKFLEQCQKDHRMLAVRFGGEISEESSKEYNQGWLDRIELAVNEIAKLSHLFKEK